MKPVGIMSLSLSVIFSALVWQGCSGSKHHGVAVESPTPLSDSKDATQPPKMSSIVAGRSHTCGLTSAGAAYCWGWNVVGQLGDGGPRTKSPMPVRVAGGLTFRKITLGAAFTCGLTAAGVAHCWGDDQHGELGNGADKIDICAAGPERNRCSQKPVQVSGGLVFKEIAAGGAHACGLTTAGDAYCWGTYSGSQLDSGGVRSKVPVKVSGGVIFKEISAGDTHTCGLTTTGVGYCWGWNSEGQLGNGSKDESQVPIKVSGGITFKEISAGIQHTCGLTADGVAYCWGWNSGGQLGNGSKDESQVPIKVSGGIAFKKISAGDTNTCGLTMAGIAYCWGWNRWGQLGNDSTDDSQVPVPVIGGLTFKEISVGVPHACGVTTDGVAYCWGLDLLGVLGNGDDDDDQNTKLPVKVVDVGRAPEDNAQQRKDSPGEAEYFVEMQRKGVTGRLEINDVPIDWWNDRDEGNSATVINFWIKPGKNSLRVRIGWSDKLEYKPGTGQLSARVMMYQNVEQSDQPKELAQIVWPEAKSPAAKVIEKYPTERSVDFEAPIAPPTELWTKATKIDLSASNRKGVFDLVMELQHAFEQKDIEKVMKLLEFKTHEISKAMYLEDSKAEKGHRRFLEEFFKSDQDQKWAMKPINEKEIEYHLIGGGLIVWVCRKDFSPLFQGPQSMAISAYIAKINGTWVVVR